MDRLRLETPKIEHKEAAIDYIAEHVEFNSPIHGSGSLARYLREHTYEEWLAELDLKKLPEYACKRHWAPSLTYFLVREFDDRIVAMFNVRFKITEELANCGCSHIGYGVRPTERRRGYAKIALYAGLIQESELGEEVALLECDTANIGSRKTIEALGGVLLRQEIDPFDGEMTNYYRIDVAEAIARYGEKYSGYLTFPKHGKDN